MLLRFLVLIAWAGAASVAAGPAHWQGVVTRVTDGDSLWVRPSTGGAPRRIRLHGIDAPEICQAYGPEARAALQRLVKGRELALQVLRVDDYGRPITRVTLDGVDVARALVREGHAWSYRWRRSPGPYAPEEAEARGARRGLFAAHELAQRPYEFRRRHGACE